MKANEQEPAVFFRGNGVLSGLCLGCFAVALLAFCALRPAAASAAPPPQLWQSGETGSGAGQTSSPRGIAADPDNGHVFVGDQINRRIVEFTAWGGFVRAWGWDVVEAGPGNTGTGFEICIPANGDTCKAGTFGSAAGQFSIPLGVALDSSGDVYIADWIIGGGSRVQKFSPSGQFLLMFGGQVNKTKVEAAAPEAEQNLCTAASGDVCQAATQGTGNGQFGEWPAGSFIAIDSADKVYVGDVDRIQRFDTAGAYQGEIELPGETVRSLAADSTGNLYIAYAQGITNSKPGIHKFSPAGAPLPSTFTVENPAAVAVDAAGHVYTFDQSAISPNDPRNDRPPILEFDPAGNQIESFGKGEFVASTGLATNLCAGSAAPGNLYITNLVYITNLESPAFLRAYGTPPNGCEPPPPVPPQIKAQYAVSVDSDGAQLRAAINPEFWADATYFVEYGDGECVAGGCEERAPLGAEAELGGGVTNVDLTTPSVFLAGLTPDTTYRYRFVAKSGGGGPVVGEEATFTTPPLPAPAKADCPNQAFRSGPSAFLPDCRAFELVSPLDKNGAGIETAWIGGNPLAHGALDQSAGDGDGLAYSSKGAFGDAAGSPFSSQYVARRDPAHGWATHGINAPREGFPGLERQALDTEYKAFTEDLSQGWLVHEGDPPLAPCAPANSPDLYRRDNLTDSYEALHCEPNKKGSSATTIELQGTSGDGCHAVFRSSSKLTADAGPTGPYQLYQSSCKGSLRLVSVLPGGTACTEEGSAGSLLNVGGALSDGHTKGVQGAFSVDAKRLYWSCGDTLYLRSDPDPAVAGDEEVVKVAGPTTGVSPRFQTASRDGARALYTGFVSGSFALRLYDAESKASTTIAAGLEDAEGKRVDLLGASEDATRTYFVSQKVLTAAPNSEGDAATVGKPNLYFHEAAAGFAFIGTLSGVGVPSGGDLVVNGRVLSPVHPLRYRRASRVSPDGLHAAFISSAPLTGYDNTDVASGEADAEVFVYDASAEGGGALHCVSCNPTGARPVGRNISAEAVEALEFWAAAWIPGWQNQLYQGRPLSEDGSRLFFNSVDALVPRDTNARQDVYEWEAAADKAGCEEMGAELHVPSAGGCLSLISSGQDQSDSEFVDADRSGSNVFIRTGQSLLPQDPGLTDIYDARVGGGFPQPTSQAACEGEACQGPPAPPNDPTPASSAFDGPGNVREVASTSKPRCTKPKTRRKGRCVTKKHKHRRDANHNRRAAR